MNLGRRSVTLAGKCWHQHSHVIKNAESLSHRLGSLTGALHLSSAVCVGVWHTLRGDFTMHLGVPRKTLKSTLLCTAKRGGHQAPQEERDSAQCHWATFIGRCIHSLLYLNTVWDAYDVTSHHSPSSLLPFLNPSLLLFHILWLPNLYPW